MNERQKEKNHCFFISPMGDENSPERNNSNYLMFTFIVPVLNEFPGMFDTDHLRSDQSASSKISPEMLRRLREDELCIVDLTGLNPNVMWEYGYRCATGKSVIVLRAKGEPKLPFDVKDDRLVEYFHIKDPDGKAYDIDIIKATKNRLRERVTTCIDEKFTENIDLSPSWAKKVEQLLYEIKDAVIFRKDSVNQESTSKNDWGEIDTKISSPKDT